MDIGAGDGYLIEFFQKHHRGIWVGIDPNPLSPTIKHGLPFPDSTFDAITSTDVIEHLGDDSLRHGITEISRVLKPAGYFLVSTLLNEDFSSRICQCPKCGLAFHRVGHKQCFSEKELVTLLTNSGLKPKKKIITHLGAYSLHPWALRFLSVWPELLIGHHLAKMIRKDIIFVCQKTN